MNGWVKLHRKITEKARWRTGDSTWVHLWTHLLLKAAHSKVEVTFRGRETKLHPGQLLTSAKQLHLETGISRSSTRRILKTLKIDQQIDQVSDNVNTLITICNWDSHQPADQVFDHQATTKRPPSDQQNKKYKKEKKDKKGKGGPPETSNGSQGNNGATMIMREKELLRVEAAIAAILNSYEGHQELSGSDRTKLVPLKSRRKELKEHLGWLI